MAPLPKGLNHIASAAVGGKVYSFGGFTQQNRGAVDSAYEYDPQSATLLAEVVRRLGNTVC
jgi:N-acetylneuraminic acid mutarotase